MSAFDSPSEAFATIMSDASLISAERDCQRTMSRFTLVYPYLLDVPDSPIAMAAPSFPYKSAHTADLSYLFPPFRARPRRSRR